MVCLLVGEGDFSFALALAAQRGPADLVASCLLHGSLDVCARANVDTLSAMADAQATSFESTDEAPAYHHQESDCNTYLGRPSRR
ncbi:hypothetical protein HPB49_010136 [Dermacentor silvarum]|uniref:Uncharacterized protein n=1 Tax=Dermacentor silvarum TaxID=543639 RepID=A0ACB8C322_DERSI|nr:hypothetical protein HPB49_010136 [Dermacentor silvarum]